MKLLLTGSLLCYAICSIAQDSKEQKLKEKIHHSIFSVVEALDFAPDSARFKRPDGTVGNSPAKLVSTSQSKSGVTHYRSVQTSNGIKVENAVFLQKVKDGKVVSTNGQWFNDFPQNLAAKPRLNEESALHLALQYAGLKPSDKRNLESKSAELVYYTPPEKEQGTTPKLAYKFDIYILEPLSRNYFYIDANTGDLLGKANRIHSYRVTGTGATALSGNREIITDYSGLYRLRDNSRGIGVYTYNLRRFADYSMAVDFTNPTINWNLTNSDLDQYALDVHWNTGKVFDYFYLKYNRNSIDDYGHALNSYVHYGVNFQNAFWDGDRMSYGDGFNKPYATLDICGHEITHGLTQYTSGLLYVNESGALNEGISDILGTAIEQYARPEKWDWKIGGDQTTLRDLSNPNAYLQPDTYKGTYWYTGTNQDQYIHRNCSVLGYWFYLLTNGGSGTNDFGSNYSVEGIGMTKASSIAYFMNTHYLFPNAGYMDAMFGSLRAAEDLFGAGSVEVQQTTNAWAAVGLSLRAGVPLVTATSYAVCLGSSTKLSIAGGNLNSATEWKWYEGSCGGTLVGRGESITVFPARTTVYYARGEGGVAGTGNCATLTVVVNPLPPTPSVTSPNPPFVSPGKPVTLFGPSGYAGYEWNTGSRTPSILVANAGYYSVRVTDQNGCLSQGSWPYRVDAAVVSTLSASSAMKPGLDFSDVQQLALAAYPNPSKSAFKLAVTANAQLPLTVIVRDYTGRVIEVKNSSGNSIMELGGNYKTGVYLAELIQGEKRLTVKLVRL